MTEIETISEAVRAALGECGIENVIAAYPAGMRERYASPVVTVGIGSGSGVSGGFAEYLGISYDEQEDTYSEIYGKRLELSLAIGIYSPKDAQYGAEKCGSIFGSIASSVSSMPSGIRVKELKCGETVFDPRSGMFRLGAEMRITALLYAQSTDDGEILDFTLRGTVR